MTTLGGGHISAAAPAAARDGGQPGTARSRWMRTEDSDSDRVEAGPENRHRGGPRRRRPSTAGWQDRAGHTGRRDRSVGPRDRFQFGLFKVEAPRCRAPVWTNLCTWCLTTNYGGKKNEKKCEEVPFVLNVQLLQSIFSIFSLAHAIGSS